MKNSLFLTSVVLPVMLLAIPAAHAGTRAPRPMIPYDQTLFLRENHIVPAADYVVPKTSTSKVSRCVYYGSNGQCQHVADFYTNVRAERSSDYRKYLIPDPSAVNPRGPAYEDPYTNPVGVRGTTQPRYETRVIKQRYSPVKKPLRSYDSQYRPVPKQRTTTWWDNW